MRNKSFNWLCRAIAFTCLLVSGMTLARSEVIGKPLIKVLILSGENNHDWQSETAALRTILAGAGIFDIRVCESPVGLSEDSLAPFDVLVDDYSGRRLGAATEKSIEKFVRSGKGLVLVHGAIDSLGTKEKQWTGLQKMASIGIGAGTTDGEVQFVPITITGPEHPVTRGIKREFRVADSVYQSINVSAGGEVLATGRIGDKELPVLVTSKYGQGRVFSTLLGHNVAAMQEDSFITTFARGVEWAASGNVTLPSKIGVAGPKADAVRILVITGGHDHETGFYSLFDGYSDLAWAPVSSSKTAFKSDIRKDFDVLVLYDFSTDLDEIGKSNLQAFAESGKGIVVLHHALLSYQQWPWWYEQVVGGRYRLAPDGNAPASAAKEGGDFYVTPVPHPITAGVGPFHILDESYKRMWMSPAIKPILTTDNPDSDSIIGWVSPYARSRVVYIELGHGHTAFRHPEYRKLVHNAILWGAGRETGK